MSKKVRRPKTVIPTMRSYDLDTILGQRGGGGFSGGGDELDDAMKIARKMQLEKMKSTMVQKTQLELEKDVNDLKRGMSSGDGGGGSSITASDIQMLSTLPEDQRAIGIQALSAYKSQGGSGGGGATGGLAPLLVMSMLKDKPQTSVTEMVIALKGLNDIVSTGKSPTSDINTVITITKMLLDAKSADQTSVTEVYKQLLAERSVDPIQQTESVVNLAKSLGMSPAGGQNPEIERMKTTSAESMQQRQHDHELMLKKMERDDARLESVINALAGPIQQLAQAFAPGMAAAIGGAAGAGLAQKPQPQQGGLISMKCPRCNYEPIWVSEESPLALCPNCKNGGVDTAVAHPSYNKQQPPGAPPTAGAGPGVPPPPSG
jgi:hypothetical protein